MTLRRRTALAVLTSCALAVVLLYFALQSLLAARFSPVETQNANRDLDRASNALNQDVAGVATTVRDMARWDASYQFMHDGNVDYVNSNLRISTLTNLAIDFVVYVDTEGQVFYSKAIDDSKGAVTPLPTGLEQYLASENPLAQHLSENSSVAGILVLPEQTALVASQPILTSRKTGPIAGSLIMGRYLDAKELKNLSALTDVSLELHRLDETDLPADFAAAQSLLSPEEASLVRVVDDNTVAGYALLSDINANPALVLRADLPREIHSQVQQSTLYVLYVLLGFLLLVSVSVILGIDRLVLSRVRRLSASVKAVAESQNISERVSVGGNDELACMAEAINGMLASMELSHLNLAESEAKNRALLDAIPDLMFRINKEGQIVEVRKPQSAKTSTGDSESSNVQHVPGELMDLLPTQIQQMAMPHVAAALESGETQVFEFQLLPDGQSPHYEARVLASGEADALVMVRDVTDRKHEEEARQKSLLLKEIHHRVKNNLQVISGLLYLQARRTKDQKLVEVLNESSNRVKSVALIHQRLQQSKDTVSVELSEYIRDLTTVLLHTRDRSSAVVKLSLDLEKNVVIGIDSAVPCGLIVNELVSNSLKHGFPEEHGGTIHISLHTDDADTITLVVGDNGVGFPPGINLQKPDSLGLQLVMSLVSQLCASLDIDTTGGTQFTIRFRESDVSDDGSDPAEEAVPAGVASGDWS